MLLSTLNRNRKGLLCFAFLFLFALSFLITGCSTEANTRDTNSTNQEQEEIEGVLFFDVTASMEGVTLNVSDGSILVYIRLTQNFSPANPEKETTAGNITVMNPESEDEIIKNVRIAKAPEQEKLKPEELKFLKWGTISIRPQDRLLTGFNELDKSGNGSVQFIMELKIYPKENIESVSQAESYAKDLAYDGKLKASYEVYMDIEKNKQLFRKVDIKIPEDVFTTDADVFLGNYSL